jgi:hypothetical protein
LLQTDFLGDCNTGKFIHITRDPTVQEVFTGTIVSQSIQRTLKKSTVITNGVGIVTYNYYFSKGQIIIVYENEGNFPINDSSGNLDYNKLVLSFEGRYYFENQKLFNKIERGKKRFSDSTDQDPGLVLKNAEQYLKLIRQDTKFAISPPVQK